MKEELLIDYIRDNQKKFYCIAYSYVKSEAAALDIIQEAVVKALENINSLRKIEYLRTWFYRIVINESINYIRKNKRILLFDNNEIIQDMSINKIKDVRMNELENEETKKELFKAMDLLEPKLRTIVILRFYEDLKIREIADITKTNENTVKTRLYKALDILKVNLEGEIYA